MLLCPIDLICIVCVLKRGNKGIGPNFFKEKRKKKHLSLNFSAGMEFYRIDPWRLLDAGSEEPDVLR
jgi:hypothetical protein